MTSLLPLARIRRVGPFVAFACTLWIGTGCGAQESDATADTPGNQASAAPPIQVSEPEPADSTDSDGDGLSDAAEAELGTSPFQADTDGDGFTDAEELLEQGFDPKVNPLRFNPRIADVPRIEVEFLRAPKVFISHTVSESESLTVDNSRSVEESTGYSNTAGSSESQRAEVSATVGVEYSATVGVMPGTTASGSYSVTGSYAEETSFNWSETQTRDNRNTLSESRSYQEGRDIVQSGGRVEVPVRITNAGDIAFSLQTIALGLRKTDLRTGQLLEMGQLETQTDRTFHDVTSLAPGESIDGLLFRAELDLAKAELLLEPGPMLVRTTHYNLLDAERVSFDHRATQIAARTSSVTVDYGGAYPTESHQVTTTSQDGQGVDLQTLLTEIMGLPVQTGTGLWRYADRVGKTKTCLLQLGELALDSAQGGYWTVQVETNTGRGTVRELFHPLEEDLDLSQLRINPNQDVQILYVLDEDRDGLGLRAETLLGLDPHQFDSDRDGVGDGEEVRRGTNPHHGPARAEIVHVAGVERRLTAEIDAQPEEGGRLAEVLIDWGDGSPPQVLPPAQRFASHEYDAFGRYEITCQAFSATEPERVIAHTTPVRVEPALIETWRITLPERTAGCQVQAHPEGGVVALYCQFPEDPQKTGQWQLARIDEAGQRVWVTPLGGEVKRGLIHAHAGHAPRLAVQSEGETLVLVDNVLHQFSRTGKPRFSVAPHPDPAQNFRLTTLTLDAKDRAYVFGRHSRTPNDRWDHRGFVVRIDAGASIAWVKENSDWHSTAGHLQALDFAAGTELVLLTEKHLVRLNEAGEVVHQSDHSHNLPTGLAAPDPHEPVIAGLMYTDVPQTGGGTTRQLLSGLWKHNALGQVVWGKVQSSQEDGSMLLGLAPYGSDGTIAPHLELAPTPPGVERKLENMRGSIGLTGFDASGRASFGLPILAIEGQAAMLYLLALNLSVAGQQDGGPIHFAWPEVDTGAMKADPKSMPVRVHIARLQANPRATGMLLTQE